jgi:hypothetical protein
VIVSTCSSPLSLALSPRIKLFRFGGSNSGDYYNDTWTFEISTRKWTELQCTGSIPSPRAIHAAVLVDDVMYVFGGLGIDGTYLGDLTALFLFQNMGSSPSGRWGHVMASDGTRVFVLGGLSSVSERAELIHVDTSTYFHIQMLWSSPVKMERMYTNFGACR